jgi:UDP-N-acetylglucosamine--N-acetylmuramyl-(pentapeptide) pyrophosphoryl-undecaprenol N-acetylglucosamine transferase
MSSLTGKTIILTSGGTGGHMFPLASLAQMLRDRGAKVVVLTDERGAKYTKDLPNVQTHRLSGSGIAGQGIVGRGIGAVRLGIGLLQAIAHMVCYRPAVVVGFGGYAALPATLAASRFGIKLVLHEQNAVLGRANRWLAPRARRVALAFKKIAGPGQPTAAKQVWTGNPVRDDIAAKADTPYPELSDQSKVRILVLGGSQGARILSDVLPDAFVQLPEAVRNRIELSQQCRPEDLDRVTNAYEGSGIQVTLKSFFDDVPERMSGAHLVIARAGASTCAELTTLGRPAILVPYPYAADDHQRFNAQQLDEMGAGWLIPQENFTAELLSQRLSELIGLPTSLSTAAECAKRVGLPDAAVRLADLVAETAGTKKESGS